MKRHVLTSSSSLLKILNNNPFLSKTLEMYFWELDKGELIFIMIIKGTPILYYLRKFFINLYNYSPLTKVEFDSPQVCNYFLKKKRKMYLLLDVKITGSSNS